MSAKYYLLDVGSKRYGDCILCVFPDATVLIDGGHKEDYEGQTGYSSIPEQLTQILGNPPFDISLLVVTHCHDDHIGCLPELVANDDIHVKWALLADDNIGFGHAGDAGPNALAAAPNAVKRVVAALREEDHGHLVGPALDRFLADAANLENRYTGMIAKLQDPKTGTTVVRYGREDCAALEQAFQSIGLKIIGPTPDHLAVCGQAIAQMTNDAIGAVSDAMAGDATLTDAALYRQLREGGVSDAADMAGKGAAINDTSIVLKLGGNEGTMLFAGDMQFAKPELPGLDDLMAAIVQTVDQNGPYKFIKLSHHSSYNGIDENIFNGWQNTQFFGHSGGINDPGHPDQGTLTLLSNYSSQLQYARTDRNGFIMFDGQGFQVSKGSLNDFSSNKAFSGRKRSGDMAEEKTSISQGGAFRSIARVPFGEADITLSFEVQPRSVRDIAGTVASRPPMPPTAARKNNPIQEGPIIQPPVVRLRLASGRKLPKLLFVTNSKQLSANIGIQEAAAAIRMIKEGSQTVIDITNPAQAFDSVHMALKKDKTYKGVVLVGGYDVLPAQRLDVLTPELRNKLGTAANNDPDSFIVWSDSIYGDIDSDGLAELPVSRIPDARSSKLVLTALQTPEQNNPVQRFGIRNSQRPFADKAWSLIQGNRKIYVSGPEMATNLNSAEADVPWQYYMLHGSDTDSSRFWGEVPGYVEALNVNHIPSKFNGCAFAGCCWGALTTQQTACKYYGGQIAPKTVESSIALSLLAAGATAFVGCTGVHYSPDATAGFFGGPMHLAFWKNLSGKKLPPAVALHQARIDYLAGMPHGMNSPSGWATERKILMEFTCLGLGW